MIHRNDNESIVVSGGVVPYDPTMQSLLFALGLILSFSGSSRQLRSRR